MMGYELDLFGLWTLGFQFLWGKYSRCYMYTYFIHLYTVKSLLFVCCLLNLYTVYMNKKEPVTRRRKALMLQARINQNVQKETEYPYYK